MEFIVAKWSGDQKKTQIQKKLNHCYCHFRHDSFLTILLLLTHFIVPSGRF